jgi:FkbM family methyltransferase
LPGVTTHWFGFRRQGFFTMKNPHPRTQFKNFTRTNDSFEEVFGGCYECDLIAAPKTVLDIGANEGAFTAWALERWPECKIEAYEPVPNNAEIFALNHTGNSRVQFHLQAVSNSETLKIHMSATNSGACSAYDIGEQLPETVTVDCIHPGAISSAEFVKIDTEGCELEILQGLDLSATKAVVLEYHRDLDCVPICSLLEAKGLKMFHFEKSCLNRGTMKFAIPGTRTVISQWRHDEVKQYDIPFDFTPATILDIGANIGCYSMRCRDKWPAARIYAYEPMPQSAAQFLRNCPEATLEIAAVRSFDGTEGIFIGDKDVTCSFHKVSGRQTEKKMEVHCISARTLPPCELVKIDTEGCEVEILENLDLFKTQALVCEYHRRADLDAIRKLATAADLVEIQHIPDHRDFNFGLLKFARKSLLAQLECRVRIPGDTELSGNTPDGKTISIRAENLRNEHYDPRLKRVKLFIGLPIYGHPTMAFVRCLMELQARKPCHIEPHVGSGDGVGRTRNVLTAEFLKSDCTHLLFMDSDLIFSVEHVKELLLADQPIVGGFYPKKQEGRLEWVVNPLIPSPPMRGDALQPLKYIGTGFLCVKREVFEKMIVAYPELRFREDYGNRAIAHDFWSMGVYRTLRLATNGKLEPDQTDEGRYLSEDWYFCQRWLDLSGEIFGHTKVALRHQGIVTFPLKTQEAEVANPLPVQ